MQAIDPKKLGEMVELIPGDFTVDRESRYIKSGNFDVYNEEKYDQQCGFGVCRQTQIVSSFHIIQTFRRVPFGNQTWGR